MQVKSVQYPIEPCFKTKTDTGIIKCFPVNDDIFVASTCALNKVYCIH